MAENNHNDNGINREAGDRPVVELFVKAAVDKMKNGSCPTCHRYFLVFYILREHGLIDLVVTTFLPQDPPKEVKEFSSGKHYPLVKVHKGVDANGQDLTGIECDAVDEIEALISRFECEDMPLRRESADEANAEKSFDNALGSFNAFMKSPEGDTKALKGLLKTLARVDEHLEAQGTKFMVKDTLTRADCYLLPTLQHIRVAGYHFKGFEIPTKFKHVWRYMKNACCTNAFRESCPADREIISHYMDKISNPPKGLHKTVSLMKEERTIEVPDDKCEQHVSGNGEYADDGE